MTTQISLLWGLSGGMHALRTGAALVGIWTYAKHHGLEEHLVDGVKALPGLLKDLVLLALPSFGQ